MKSLLGKDEANVFDRLQSLIRKGEHFDALERDVEKIEKELDESKEENHYLNNKLDYKRDLIEDMEIELNKYERQVEEAKSEIELKEKELKDFEACVGKQVEEINVLRDNCQSMISQISENILMEKKIEVQNNIIKELKERLNEAEKVNKSESTEDVDKLILEVQQLQNENKKKISLIETIEKENNLLKENLEVEIEKNASTPLNLS